jgi:trans-2,3-dihydro-3-hydroxyanthranilate isomerase
MPRGCQIVRVFTRGGAGGNHLGVVNDVSGLDDESMQAIAAELGFSETVFADWRDIDRPPQLRIFTPSAELPFAGHPLVGAAWVYTHLGPGGPGVLECPAGVVGYRAEGDAVWVEATVPVSVDGTAPGGHAVTAAGLPRPIRTWTVRLPIPYLVAEMADDSEVTAAKPDPGLIGETEIYVFHRDGADVHARFFAPALGVVEDPATGRAAVALAHVLTAAGEAEGDLTIHQGEEMGAPSSIRLRWSPGMVEIGGSVARDGALFLER